MDIFYDDEHHQRLCADPKLMKKKLGASCAKKLQRRLDDLDAAQNLEEMSRLPGRCHELEGDRKGQLSLDLDHPYRLIFQPEDQPPPTKPDGGLDRTKVEAIRILFVGEDYH